jgi:hypothetical protein
MCRICFSFIVSYQVTSKVKVSFCKHKPDINYVSMTSNTSLSILKNILKLCESSVDNSVESAWNPLYFGRHLIQGGIQHDLRAVFLLIRLLLIARRIIIMHKASTMSSPSLRPFCYAWRKELPVMEAMSGKLSVFNRRTSQYGQFR